MIIPMVELEAVVVNNDRVEIIKLEASNIEMAFLYFPSISPLAVCFNCADVFLQYIYKKSPSWEDILSPSNISVMESFTGSPYICSYMELNNSLYSGTLIIL